MTEKMAAPVPEVSSVQASPKKVAKVKSPKKAGPKKPVVKPDHPSVAEMVNAAIVALKEKKGSSLQAIKKYIVANYKIDIERQSVFIRKYLKAAVTNKTIVQTKGSGASGSFKLAVKAEGVEKKVSKKPASVKKSAAKTSKTVTKTKEGVAKTVTTNKTVAKISASEKTTAKKATTKKSVTKKPATKNPVTGKSVAVKKSTVKPKAAKPTKVKTVKSPTKPKAPKPKKAASKTATKAVSKK